MTLGARSKGAIEGESSCTHPVSLTLSKSRLISWAGCWFLIRPSRPSVDLGKGEVRLPGWQCCRGRNSGWPAAKTPIIRTVLERRCMSTDGLALPGVRMDRVYPLNLRARHWKDKPRHVPFVYLIWKCCLRTLLLASSTTS